MIPYQRFVVVLDDVVQIMRNDITVQDEIIGHSDSTGSDESIKELSKKREHSVGTHLVANRVESSHLKINWKSEGQPIADNSTTEGRALNRRVEVILYGQLPSPLPQSNIFKLLEDSIFSSSSDNPYSDRRVREAIGTLLDYDRGGPGDPIKAKKLLAEAGYPNGFELTLSSSKFRG